MYLWMYWRVSFSANLCKCALDVPADVILEAICNTDILTIIMQVRTFNKMLKAIWMTTKRTEKKSKVITCHNCTFYNVSLSLVLCDSWSGHKDEQVLLESFGGKDVDLKIIPSKTTKYAQPLDVYFFRQYKIYARRITDFIKLRSSNMQPKLHDRFLYHEIAFCHLNQLSAEAYRPMLRYAGY